MSYENPNIDPPALDELTEARIDRIESSSFEELEKLFEEKFGEDRMDAVLLDAADAVGFNHTPDEDMDETIFRIRNDVDVMLQAYDDMRAILIDDVLNGVSS